MIARDTKTKKTRMKTQESMACVMSDPRDDEMCVQKVRMRAKVQHGHLISSAATEKVALS